jgi:hypothetical protein
MSWAIVKADQVIEIIGTPKGITLNGIHHPASIFSVWSLAELKAIGIYPVIQTSTLDERTHRQTGGVTYTVNTNDVSVHYNKVAHTLDDVTTDGIVAPGLKTSLKEQVERNAYSILQPSDWMTVRQIETGVTIADNWKTYRAAVRTQAAAMTTAINAVTTITDVPSLYVTYASASDGTLTSVSSGYLWHWPKSPDEA